jgi:HlyD family secretion protein
VLAKLDATALEVSLAQAEVAQDQAQLAQAQAQTALDQAKLGEVQAESSLVAAQFNLDRVQPVSDIEDSINTLQNQKAAAQANLTQAQAAGNDAGVNAMTQYVKDLQYDILTQQQRLASLLQGVEYSGPNALTYDVFGQTYDRLTLEDTHMKELAVEAAQKAVDQANGGIAMAQKNLDQSQDGITLAQTNVNYLQKQIDDCTMTAPFDGVVATLYYKQGDIIPLPEVAPQIVVYLVDTTNLEADVNVDEMDIPSVQAGQNAIIRLDALPGSQMQGKVGSISTIPNPQAAAAGATVYVAKVNFSVPQGLVVKAGMNTNVDIITMEEKNVLLLPDQAIKQDSQGKAYVQVMNNQQTVNQQVVIGACDGVRTEIISGLKEGDKVVTGLTWSLPKK